MVRVLLLMTLAVVSILVALSIGSRLLLGSQAAPPPVSSLPPTAGALAEGRLVFDSSRTGNFEIYTMASDGSDVRQLTHDPQSDAWWGRISPDRRRILFYRAPAGVHDTDPTQNSLWMMNADGSAPVEIRPRATDGWALQGHAEWSPDGTELVMAGGGRLNPQIQVTSITGHLNRAITQRGGTNIDPSWLPDGGSILFVGCPRSFCTEKDYEVYRVPSAGGEPSRLTNDARPDYDPYASPDGLSMAWLTKTSDRGSTGAWNIRRADIDGSDLGMITNDSSINSKPAWSADGRTIYFHRLEIGRSTRFQIFRVDSHGGPLIPVTGDAPGVNEYPGV